MLLTAVCALGQSQPRSTWSFLRETICNVCVCRPQLD